VYDNLVPFQEEELTAAAVRVFVASSHAYRSVCYKKKRRRRRRRSKRRSPNYGANAREQGREGRVRG
jgi:hypothetical protein